MSTIGLPTSEPAGSGDLAELTGADGCTSDVVDGALDTVAEARVVACFEADAVEGDVEVEAAAEVATDVETGGGGIGTALFVGVTLGCGLADVGGALVVGAAVTVNGLVDVVVPDLSTTLPVVYSRMNIAVGK